MYPQISFNKWKKDLSYGMLVFFTCAMHGRVLPEYDVRRSVRPSGVTLMDCDHISLATWNFITLLISPLSELFACKT